jgi:hypothetical protein
MYCILYIIIYYCIPNEQYNNKINKMQNISKKSEKCLHWFVLINGFMFSSFFNYFLTSITHVCLQVQKYIGAEKVRLLYSFHWIDSNILFKNN